MSVREGTDRRVSFNTRDELGDKIDKLMVVMSKLAAKDSHERKSFKPQIYKKGDKTDPMVKQDTKAGQTMETGDIA